MINKCAAFALVFLSVFSTACSTTSQDVVANGQPLVVRTHTAHYAGRFNVNDEWEKEHTEERFDGHSQGEQEIDELDFYYIAGDQKAVDHIVKSRSSNNFANITMWSVAAVGGGLVVSGFLVGGDAAQKDDNFAETPQGQLSGGLILGGIVTLFAAYLGVPTFLMSNDSVDDGYLFDRIYAAKTADAYNEKIGKPQVSE